MTWYVVLFIVSSLVGYRIVSRVPSLLHTPLMSGMNALSGITILGAFMAVAGAAALHSRIIGAAAVLLATVNIVAGFFVTHRMLRMFRDTPSEDNVP
jgi:NAD(P) transhydrogenase subunit alpha